MPFPVIILRSGTMSITDPSMRDVILNGGEAAVKDLTSAVSFDVLDQLHDCCCPARHVDCK